MIFYKKQQKSPLTVPYACPELVERGCHTSAEFFGICLIGPAVNAVISKWV
jgi:hypothetical protein